MTPRLLLTRIDALDTRTRDTELLVTCANFAPGKPNGVALVSPDGAQTARRDQGSVHRPAGIGPPCSRHRRFSGNAD